MVLDPSDVLLRSIDLLANQFPGVARHIKQRVILSDALRPYRTPVNDHLRRSLRLSWLNAATALMHDRTDWARTNPRLDSARDLKCFEPIFEGARNVAIKAIFQLESGECIGDSPIDNHLDALIESLPDHLRGDEMAPELRDAFVPTLAAVTGLSEAEIPQELVRAAREGIAPRNAKLRHFGQLFADEFARVLQDPKYYPEAAGSFQLVQARAQANLQASLYREVVEVAKKLPKSVADEVDRVIAELPFDWLSRELKYQFEHLDQKLDDVRSDLRELPAIIVNEMRRADRKTSVLESHLPSQERTVMFAWCQDNRPTAGGFIDRISDQVSRRAARISERAAIVPLAWNFSASLDAEGREGDYVETDAWKTINDKVIGAVLVLNETMSEPIVPSQDFLFALEGREWLQPTGRFEDAHHMRGRQLMDLVRNGGIPLTYEARFALECLLSGIPLCVISASAPSDARQPTSSLIAFLKDQGAQVLVLDDVRSDAAWSDIFVAGLPGVHLSTIKNPYRALDFYQADDADDFVGRERQAEYAAADIRLALANGRPLLLGITGPSGCGKSSFLRASVAAMAHDQHGLVPLEMRPTDFQCGENAAVLCLPVLMTKLATLTGVEFQELPAGPRAPHHTLLLPRVKAMLDGAIAKGALPRMMICVDQFEEVIDDLSENVNAGEWRSLIALFRHLNEVHGWPVAFTLEDSRKDRFEHHKEALGFGAASMLNLPDDDKSFFRSVIVLPFRKVGIDLDPDIVDVLLDEVSNIRSHSEVSSSPLPLLALRLSQLFEALAPKAPRNVQESRLSQSFNRLLVRLEDLMETSLALNDMIADLAETAWRVGGGEDDSDAVKYFLRPLVRMSVDRSRPGTGKLVLKHVRARGYRAEQVLHDAFLKYRLLIPGSGGYRLVHEAVIRRWPRALEWFEAEQGQLETVALFRSEAIAWTQNGRTDIGKRAPDEINQAALVLSDHIREWALGDQCFLDDEDQLLRDYTIAVFQRSETPSARIRTDEPSGTHMHLAAGYGLDDLIERFAALDPEAVHQPNAKTGVTPLGSAAWRQLSTVRLLLKHGARPDAMDNSSFTAIDGAVWGERPEILKEMVKQVDASSWPKGAANPLCGAARRGRTDIAEILVQAGFRYDQDTANGFTPLHQAAIELDGPAFRYFLQRGDVTARDKHLQTPLHVAARYGNLAVVEQILASEAGAGLVSDTESHFGTPLMLAAKFHQHRVVAFLVPLMADRNQTIDRPPFSGYNALHMVFYLYHTDEKFTLTSFVRGRMLATAKALLEDRELDVGATSAPPMGAGKGRQGLTPWEMASGLPEIQRLIAAHPRFPEHRLRELREGEKRKRADRIRTALFDAAREGNRHSFEAALNNARSGWNLENRRTLDDTHVATSHLMLENGWHDLLQTMQADGQIDPWDTDGQHYSVLYTKAVGEADAKAIAWLETIMPETLPAFSVAGLLAQCRVNDDRKIDSAEAERIARLVLSRTDPVAAVAAQLRFVRLWHEPTVQDLAARGAGLERKDSWGRTVLDVAPDVVRSSRGLEPLAGPVSPRGDCFFYPGAKGWSDLNDTYVVASIDKSEEMPWDERVTWSSYRLPFYPDDTARILRANHPDWPAKKFLYYLNHDDKLYWLNGSSSPIHEFNAKYTLSLAGDRAMAYLKFYCFFVRGEEGPFYVIDGRDAALLPQGMTQDEHQKLHAVFQGPRDWGFSEDDNRRISSQIYYSNAVFTADFNILPTGTVEMVDDWSVLWDLTAKVDAPLA